MKRLCAAVGLCLVCVWAAVPTEAALINFTPQGSTSVVAGDPIVVDLEMDLQGYGSFDFVHALFGIGSLGSPTGADLGLVYDGAWLGSFDGTSLLADQGIRFDQEIIIDSWTNFGPIGPTSLAMGALTISTTGMALGNYTIMVDNTNNESQVIWSQNELAEPADITGSFGFEIVPEPSACVLMLLGAASLVGRRR